MRYVRKLGLLVVMAAAAMALLASSASAQVTVVKEFQNGNNTPCTAATIDNHIRATGNCNVRAVSTEKLEFYQHIITPVITEVPFLSCNNVFEAVFNTNGSGWIYNQVLTPEGGECGREPCDEPSTAILPEVAHRNLAWPAQLREVPGATPPLKLDVTFCLRAHVMQPEPEGGPGFNCTVTLDVTTTVAHTFAVRTPNPHNHLTGDSGTRCVQDQSLELIGAWASAPLGPNHPDDIEITHP